LPSGDQFVVLHQLGNHGPAYDHRYPEAFRRFVPVCDTPDLRRCSREQIVNAYDNALLYTDHLLARTIDWLKTDPDGRDTALVYVSDHGESLGENGLYLHGVPYAIAPDVQTRVPMLMWLSDGLARRQGIDVECLRQRGLQPASHDHLFHSMLGLLDVRTALYEPSLDLFAACRH
jgi:lipid A ethanolaminephosphotransferase